MSYVIQNSGLQTAFGETETTQSEAYIEGSPIYDLVPSNFREFTSASGTTAAESRMFKVTTGTTVFGYGAIQSFRSISHRVGKAVTLRAAGYFSTNVANSWQGIGLISIGEELSFGYNGTSFGVWNRYGGLPEVRTITVTGASGGSTDLTLTLNSVAYTIPLTAGTVQHNAYEIADWLNDSANQAVWGADQVDDTVIISALSDGAKSGTYSFSHATATGTIAQNRVGVTKTSDFIAQDDWNGQGLSQTLDPSKGNVFQIAYQNMGFGIINYSIMDAETGKFVVVHTIRTPNSGTVLKVPNPSLRAGMYAASIGSTTNLEVYASAFSVAVDGFSTRTRNPRSLQNTQTLSGTSFLNVITLRNRRTYNYYNNQVTVIPLKVTVASESSKNVIVEVRAATDTGVEQNFVAAGNDLVTDYDTSAVTITAGRLLDSITIAPNSEGKLDLGSLEIEVPPTLHLVVQARRTGGSAADVNVTLTWYEDL